MKGKNRIGGGFSNFLLISPANSERFAFISANTRTVCTKHLVYFDLLSVPKIKLWVFCEYLSCPARKHVNAALSLLFLSWSQPEHGGTSFSSHLRLIYKMLNISLLKRNSASILSCCSPAVYSIIFSHLLRQEI